MNIVVNTSLAPMGGFVDSSGGPLYNTPDLLAQAVNANYAAQGIADRVSSTQMEQYFQVSPPLSGTVPAKTNPPPSSGGSTNANSGTGTSSGATSVGISGLEIIIGVIGVGLAVLSMSGKKGRHES